MRTFINIPGLCAKRFKSGRGDIGPFGTLNIEKIHTVLNDTTGKTGKSIVEAIISGERNAIEFPSVN